MSLKFRFFFWGGGYGYYQIDLPPWKGQSESSQSTEVITKIIIIVS